MALDGMVIANIVYELERDLAGGRIAKIAQPEKDELLLTIKQSRTGEDGKAVRSQKRLVLSVNPSLPLIYETGETKNSPMTAPTFCMVLRKHLSNSRILSVRQIGLERVLCFELEHLNEMGDLCHKKLYIELMGKHSNIIFCQEDDVIIDSIKRVSALVSSVREVLPGRTYFIPNTQEKLDPFTVSCEEFTEKILTKPMPPAKALYTSLTGFSPVMANELLYRASLQDASSTSELSDMERLHLFRNFDRLREELLSHSFAPTLIKRGQEPVEFAAFPLTSYERDETCQSISYDSISRLLYDFYAQKELYSRIHQKSFELRRVTNTALERCRKKYELQVKQLRDTKKRDKYKVYGDLLTTYGYSLAGGEKSFIMRGFDITNRAVYEKATSDPEMMGMGTTGVCAYAGGGLAHVVHAGDSRAYLFHEGEMRQITRDHSMVQQLVDSGKITREQAAQHPKKNLITRALGVSANIVPEYNRCEIEVGDILLLCSDGLTNMISDEEIALVLREVPFFEAPSILVDRALQAGGQDNITVLLMGVEITEVNHG